MSITYHTPLCLTNTVCCLQWPQPHLPSLDCASSVAASCSSVRSIRALPPPLHYPVLLHHPPTYCAFSIALTIPVCMTRGPEPHANPPSAPLTCLITQMCSLCRTLCIKFRCKFCGYWKSCSDLICCLTEARLPTGGAHTPQIHHTTRNTHQGPQRLSYSNHATPAAACHALDLNVDRLLPGSNVHSSQHGLGTLSLRRHRGHSGTKCWTELSRLEQYSVDATRKQTRPRTYHRQTDRQTTNRQTDHRQTDPGQTDLDGHAGYLDLVARAKLVEVLDVAVASHALQSLLPLYRLRV